MTDTSRTATCAIVALLLFMLALSPRFVDAAERGDILVTEFAASSGSKIGHYRADGTYVESLTGTGIGWLGADTLPNGMVVTTVREPKAVHVFGAGSFPIDEIVSPGDLDVFSDGTIAVADQGNPAIELYSPDGTHIRSITSARHTSTFGLFIDARDHLWAADLYPGGALHAGSNIYEYDKLGNLLRELRFDWNASDLVVDHSGNLWVANWWQQDVMHLRPTGELLNSFPVPTTKSEANHFGSIALDLSGNVLTIVREDPVIYRLSSSGELLQQIPRVSTADANGFMTVVGYIPEPATHTVAAIAIVTLLFGRPSTGRVSSRRNWAVAAEKPGEDRNALIANGCRVGCVS